jgi:DNA-binding transcriptional LysR family regulator
MELTLRTALRFRPAHVFDDNSSIQSTNRPGGIVLDLHRLRLLRELKHRGTLAAVAAALSYSPSTISAQLSQLEREIGVPLLAPVGRRVRLTPEAELLVDHVEAILEQLERAEADLARVRTVLAGDLRIATFQTAARTLVLPALTRLNRDHPGLRVHLSQEEPQRALPALLAHDYDLVLAEEYPGDPNPQLPGVHTELLTQDALRLATPPGAAPPALESLVDRAWVMEPDGTAARRWALGVCRRSGFEPDIRYQSADLTLHISLIEEGHAVGFLPDLVWGTEAPTVTLTDLPPPNVRHILIAARSGAHRHPFIDAARTALGHVSQAVGRGGG